MTLPNLNWCGKLGWLNKVVVVPTVCCCVTVCRLRSLELGSCAITDEGLAKLVRTCHGLTALNIGQCSHITDTGLSLIAENLQNLESIDLYGCTKITAVGLQQIMKLPKLSTLNLGLWHKWWSYWSNFDLVKHIWWAFKLHIHCVSKKTSHLYNLM